MLAHAFACDGQCNFEVRRERERGRIKGAEEEVEEGCRKRVREKE